MEINEKNLRKSKSKKRVSNSSNIYSDKDTPIKIKDSLQTKIDSPTLKNTFFFKNKSINRKSSFRKSDFIYEDNTDIINRSGMEQRLLNNKEKLGQDDDGSKDLIDHVSFAKEFKISKSFNRIVFSTVLKQILIIIFLSTVLYLQVYHIESFIQMETAYLPRIYMNLGYYKKYVPFEVYAFISELGYITPLLACTIIVIFSDRENVRLHLTISNFLFYSTLGVILSFLLKGERPFWDLGIGHFDLHLCKRHFSNPDPLLFNFFGFCYYFNYLFKKYKTHFLPRILFALILIILNLLFFLFLYIDAQIYLSQYLLMPGFSFACISVLKPLNKPLKRIFEGLSVKRVKHKTTRFYLLLALFLWLFIQNSLLLSTITEDRNIDYIANVVTCFTRLYKKPEPVLPNRNYDKIVGAYPTMFYSQGVYGLIGMLVGLFTAHYMVKDNGFWYQGKNKVFYWRVLLSVLVIVLTLGRPSN